MEAERTGPRVTLAELVDYGSPWRAEAKCRGMDPKVFFPEWTDGQRMVAQSRAAKAICADCPVQEPCLESAMEAGKELPGVWGGTGPSDRRVMRRQAS